MGSNTHKRVKHFHAPGEFHALTFSCYERLPLLVNSEWLVTLSRHIDRACREASFDLVAFVYMPEHVHLLVFPRLLCASVSHYLARLKQPFSREIRSLLFESCDPLLQRLTVRERPGKYCFRFWQEGSGYDRNLSSREAIRGSIDYFHLNPVRRGLCERAIEWPWSSARYYLLDPPKQQFPELPHVHGLPWYSLD